MNSKLKIILAVVLVCASAGVWIPQFSGRGSEPEFMLTEEIPASEGELPADESAATRTAGRGTPHITARAPETAAANPGAAPTTNLVLGRAPDVSLDPLRSLDGLERALDAMESFAPRDPHSDLAGLLAAVRAPDENPVDERRPDPGDWPATISTPTPARERLAEFALAHPLTGIIYGEDDSRALIGHRIVREGDRLGGGDFEVGSIGPHGVTLRFEEEELRVDLPPFMARRATAVNSGDADASEDDGEEGGVTENEPANVGAGAGGA